MNAKISKLPRMRETRIDNRMLLFKGPRKNEYLLFHFRAIESDKVLILQPSGIVGDHFAKSLGDVLKHLTYLSYDWLNWC